MNIKLVVQRAFVGKVTSGKLLEAIIASSTVIREKGPLIEALNQPEERQAAAVTMRTLIEKIVLTPGPNRGEIDAMLYGELGTIMNWIERQDIDKAGKKTKPAAFAAGLSVSMVAGAGFEPAAR